LSRPIQTAVTVDGSLYATGTTYDANGRMQSVTYPSGFGVTYSYTATGFLNKVADSVSGLAYWTANSYDAESHLTQETLGNGLADAYSYDANTGRLLTIQAGTSGAVENASYHWDPLGNLTQRIDYAAGLTDALTYDGMNRLTQVATSNPGQNRQAFLTTLYRSMRGRRLCGVLMKNLSHGAPFCSDSKNAPSKHGIRHQGAV
jgi:YD repeat-containing protein